VSLGKRGGRRASRRASDPGTPAIHEPCLPGLGPEGPEPALESGLDDRPRALLFGSPREVLARISNGDPLGIRARVAACLGRERILVDADRLHLRALAHCARRAPRLRGSEGLRGFLESCVRDAAGELLREDRDPGVRHSSVGGIFAALGEPLGLDPREAREACSAFNDCAPEDRRACLELLIEGRTIDELAKRDGVSVSEVARRARRALDAGLSQLRSAGGSGDDE
jgi:DNA-directed RNA polymerase specialized sigma24 family protein